MEEVMSLKPRVVAFDIIETTFSLSALKAAFEQVGLAPQALELWFTRSLRDFFALGASGTFAPFPAVLRHNLVEVGRLEDRHLSPDDVREVLGTLSKLRPHAEARPALETLKGAGFRCIALSNGTAAGTRALFENAGLTHLVERQVTVDDIGWGKPRREVYEHAAKVCGVSVGELCLVAAHPWDIHGAAQAGLKTAYVARRDSFPDFMRQPDVVGGDLRAVAEMIAGV
jgi:2-haloacid dehalogenase